MCRCVTKRSPVDGVTKFLLGILGGGEGKQGHLTTTDHRNTGKGRGETAGELGYENYVPIMRINNHICSWHFSFFSLPNQINHRRSP